MKDNKELTKVFKRAKTRFIRTVVYTVIGCLMVINLIMALLPVITKEAFKKQEVYAKKARLYDILLREPLVDYITIDSKVGLLDTLIHCNYEISIQGNSSIHVEENIKIPNFSGYAKFEHDLEQYTTSVQLSSIQYLLSGVHRRNVNLPVNESLLKKTINAGRGLRIFPQEFFPKWLFIFTNRFR
ncbi:MAG TPA: hypothetical protein PK604_12595 [Acetivibrio clariflavus]|nr:hypothetical protein [Acetivibrio clariflavus]